MKEKKAPKKEEIKKIDPWKIINISEEDEKKLIEQCEREYEYCNKEHNQKYKEKWKRWENIFGNIRNEKIVTADKTLQTIFFSNFASLYNDRLMIDFLPVEESDLKRAESLRKTAEFDYRKMEKAIVDYYWIWDACFYGRGYVFLHEFDRTENDFCPIIENMIPEDCRFDPKAISVNGIGIRKKGQCRFFFWNVKMTRAEIEEVYNFSKEKAKEITEDQKIEETDGTPEFYADIKENEEVNVIRSFTIFKSRKVLAEIAEIKGKKRIIRMFELGKIFDSWCVIDRALNPRAKEFYGESIPKLIEDAHIFRDDLTDAVLAGINKNTYRKYAYDSTRVKSLAQLQDPPKKMELYIPVQGDPRGLISEIPRQEMRGEAQWALNYIRETAEKVTGTPEMQQGAVSSEKRTATEMALISQKADARFSLTASVFMWSEKAFWRQWYRIYQGNFSAENGDKKIIRINGSSGYQFFRLDKDVFPENYDPDISIESKAISEAKRAEKLNAMYTFFDKAIQLNQTVKVRWEAMLKKLGKMSGLENGDIDQLLPKTMESLIGDMIVESISKKKIPTGILESVEDLDALIDIVKTAPEGKEKDLTLKMITAFQIGKSQMERRAQEEQEQALREQQMQQVQQTQQAQQQPQPQGVR